MRTVFYLLVALCSADISQRFFERDLHPVDYYFGGTLMAGWALYSVFRAFKPTE